MSLVSLTNTCFKTCILKNKQGIKDNEEDPATTTARLDGLLDYLEVSTNGKWLLTEGETVCMHNCGKSFVELKGFLHEQLLKDYTYVRKKNRTLFEGL